MASVGVKIKVLVRCIYNKQKLLLLGLSNDQFIGLQPQRMAEHAAVNRRVVGSSPTGGARAPPRNREFCYSLKSLKVQISINFSSKVYFQAYNLVT